MESSIKEGPVLTPIERHGDIWIKRDDLYRSRAGGAVGGKARTCFSIIKDGPKPRGVVTAGSRSSPQVNIVAQICKALNLPCRVHTPEGSPGPEVEAAIAAGAIRISHKAGYNSVIVSRAERDALVQGWRLVPFGMDCQEAVHQTKFQVESIAEMEVKPKRIVVPVGSGMSLAGILAGLEMFKLQIPVLGIKVGADPTRRLNRYAPLWKFNPGVKLVQSPAAYHDPTERSIDGIQLDPIYEAKCVDYLEPGDLFWIVGIRQTLIK